MKLALLAPAVVTVVIAVGGSAVASATHATGAPPCVPKMGKIQGKVAAESCGPATATVTVSGKTYSFKNGLCTTRGKTTFLLQLGTLVEGSVGNAGYPSLGITVSGTSAILTGYSNGRKIIPVADFLVTAKNEGKNNGTFSSGHSSSKLTGAWNCHGAIFKT